MSAVVARQVCALQGDEVPRQDAQAALSLGLSGQADGAHIWLRRAHQAEFQR